MTGLKKIWPRQELEGDDLSPLSNRETRFQFPKRGNVAVLQFLALPIVLIAFTFRLSAQPVAPLDTVADTPTNVPQPVLVTTASETNFTMPTKLERENYLLSTARFQASTRDFAQAEKSFVKLLAEDVPDNLQQTALFELAETVQAQSDWPRAQAIFSQYLQRWPGDVRTPEIYLHQGQIFRQMGLPNLALAKFYGVMTTALSLKNDQINYFKRLVLQAQVEVAETHYLAGQYKDAVDYYSRLLAQDDPSLDRAQIQFRLIRSLGAIKRNEEAVSQAQDFLTRYPEAPDEPEVRYHLAEALKGQGRTGESLQQVLLFLKEERAKTKDRPEVWAYWQERVGNEIGNELYQEGDFVRALQVYLALTQLDPAPAWRLPVNYQVGITYEKLLQPNEAMVIYRSITNSVASLSTNDAPGLKAVVEMANWRLNFLEWQHHADAFNHETDTPPANTNNVTLNQP